MSIKPVMSRMFTDLASDRGRGFNMGAEEITQLFDDLMGPHKKGLSDKEQLDANKKFDDAILKYKGILYDDMMYAENTYGKLMTQLHPEDVAAQIGTGKDLEHRMRFQQDADQLLRYGGQRYFDLESNEDDKHYKELINYYTNVNQHLLSYNTLAHGDQDARTYDLNEFMENSEATKAVFEQEKNIGGPQMSPKLFRRYLKDVQERERTEGYMEGKLFGRYLPGNEPKIPENEEPFDKYEEEEEGRSSLLRELIGEEPEKEEENNPLNTAFDDGHYGKKKKLFG